MSHEFFIRRCLALAEQGRGKTGANPLVGAVLVRPAGRVESGKWKVENESIIGEGYHQGFGKSHAELHLFEKLEHKISSDDILYVNLEPCCQTNKKTPPCAQMLIEKGIKHVVYGMKDPNPEVSGKGIDLLIKNNVQVSGPILEQESKRLNRGFVSLMTKSRPWITVKKAQMVDGRIANDDGSMMRITTPEQNDWAHRFLRARHDAILVGLGTIIKDDSRLTVRYSPTPNPSPAGGGEKAQPYRIVLDPALVVPLGARIINEPLANGTIVVTGPDHDPRKADALRSRGVRIIEISCSKESFDWPALWKALTVPTDDFFGVSSILVEGGPKTWNTFSRGGFVDEEVTLVG